MTKLFKTSLAIMVLVVIVFACNKDKGKSNQTSATIDPNTVEEEAMWEGSIGGNSDVTVLLNELEKPLNVKNVNVGSSGQVQVAFPDGLTLNVFLPLRKKSDGTNVSGDVKFEEILLREKGDFILQNRPTQTSSELIVTGGSYYLSISQNGEELTGTYQISVPQSSEDFQIFEGEDAGNNENIWNLDNESTRWQRQFDSTAGADTFYNYCCLEKFNWINFDYFYSCGCPLTKIEVRLPKEFGNLNTRVMCVFKNDDIVSSLRGNKDTKLFETGAGYQAPIGEDVTLVVMSRKSGKYYFSTKDVTLAVNTIYDITPNEVTLAAMKASIAGL